MEGRTADGGRKLVDRQAIEGPTGEGRTSTLHPLALLPRRRAPAGSPIPPEGLFQDGAEEHDHLLLDLEWVERLPRRETREKQPLAIIQ